MSCSATPETTWLGTEREKVAYFTERHSLSADESACAGLQSEAVPGPFVTSQRSCRLDSRAGEEVVFVYVVDRCQPGESSARSSTSHRRLLQRLHRWTIRLVPFPIDIARNARALHTSIAGRVVAAPLAAGGRRRIPVVLPGRGAHLRTAAPSVMAVDAARYAAARRAFGAPRFYAAYRAWRAQRRRRAS